MVDVAVRIAVGSLFYAIGFQQFVSNLSIQWGRFRSWVRAVPLEGSFPFVFLFVAMGVYCRPWCLIQLQSCRLYLFRVEREGCLQSR